MRKISLASALCLGLMLAACGGGGSDGGTADSTSSATSNTSAGKTSTASNSGSTTNGNTSGSPGNTNSTGAGSSGSGNTGSDTHGAVAIGTGSVADETGSVSVGSDPSFSRDPADTPPPLQPSPPPTHTTNTSDPGTTDTTTAGGGSTAKIGNTIPVVVSSASSVRNFPLVSVTICQPNSSAQKSCTTVDNVLLDTGSFGLRLYASVIPSATLAALPVQVDATSGSNVAACAAFGSGYTWGSLRNADVKLGDEVAAAVPIQVMSDPAIVSKAPASCVWSTALSSPSALGANGVLGIGVARNDCGVACAGPVPQVGYSGSYYADTNPAIAIVMPVANQVTNPVTLFPVDNNGVIVDMPTVPDQGAVTATGTVTFGIDLQTNNLLAGTGATVFNTDLYGNFKGSLNGANTIAAFIDSGSNALVFQDTTIPQSSGQFYAPTTALTRPVALSSSNGASAMVNLNIGNATTMFKSANYAFNNLAAYVSQTIDFGMPFFYGRRIYYGIAGTQSVGGGSGPYVAFTAL